ncbi:lantibiotic dehydratase [Fibrisoma limi]|nr:lantibiotic dehydratase [Fibrisoma limi]
MKKENELNPFFVIRLPYRPISDLIVTAQQSKADNDLTQGRLLQTILQQPWAEEALFLASPDLYQAWLTAIHQPDKLTDSLSSTLWRYVFRWYSRPTPFGLFAGTGVGRLGVQSVIEFNPQAWKPVSRPDTRILQAVCRALEDDRQIRSQLIYSLNNSLYEANSQYRFSERNGSYTSLKIELSSFPITPDLQTLVLRLRADQPLPFAELVKLYGLEWQREVTEFLHALIDNQFLVSNLSMPVTGQDQTAYILSQLQNLTFQEHTYSILQNAQRQLETQALELNTLQQVHHNLQRLLTAAPESKQTNYACIQTDLFFYPDRLELESGRIQTISRQLIELLPILQVDQQLPIQDFIDRFRKVYDRQAVDLLTVLDPEVGIGFSPESPLTGSWLQELPFELPSRSTQISSAFDNLREALYSRYTLSQQHELEITDQDINQMKQNRRIIPLPPLWYLHGEFYESRKQSDWRFAFNSSATLSPAFFFGRFCHGHAQLEELTKQLSDWEQQQFPDDILAEIVHLPTQPLTAGNVVARPILRAFEIPYLTPAGVCAEKTINLQDLLVSVRANGEIVLHHKPTGRRIRPRLSNAHNPALGDEIYQFLAYVHRSESQALAWSWGSFSQLPRLPRLRYKNFILNPAQWTIRKTAVGLTQPLTIDTLRAVYQLPRFVQLIEGENKLLLDLAFRPGASLLLDAVDKHEKIVLKEWLGESYNPWLKQGNNHYISEVIIPMKSAPRDFSSRPTSAGQPQREQNQLGPLQRKFIPGDEWLFLKLYATEQITDSILINLLVPLHHRAMTNKWSSKMFFIRYSDPDHHLRIRFQVTPYGVHKLLDRWNRALKPYLQSGIVKSVSIETYDREVERYHPNWLEHCETIFSADSLSLLTWLKQQQEPTELERYRYAIASVQLYLSSFHLSLGEMTSFTKAMQEAFFSENKGTKALKQKVNELYRKNSLSLFTASPLMEQLLNNRHSTIRPPVESILLDFERLPDKVEKFDVIADLIHMAINRIFPSYQRKHEWIVYHFLARHYETKTAFNNRLG